MVAAQQMVTCIFCGLRRPGSGEDVVSKWIRRTLNPATEIIIRAEPAGVVPARSQLAHLRNEGVAVAHIYAQFGIRTNTLRIIKNSIRRNRDR